MVVALFQCCCPAAVAGLVVACRIGPAIQRLARWTLAHIRQKVSETVMPALANLNASAAIAGKLVMTRFQTATAHRLPAQIGRARVTAGPLPMNYRAGAHGANATTTCLFLATAKRPTAYRNLSATVTTRTPQCRAGRRHPTRQNRQTAKPLSLLIYNQFTHRYIL